MSQSPEPLTGSIIPTFYYYAVPSLIGLVAITTANLVDGLFVGNFVGSDALAAITLMIPYFTLLFGLALMLAIGGSVRIGKYIGEKKIIAASAMFSKALTTTVIVTLLFAVLSLPTENFVFRLLGAPATLHPFMTEYFSVIRWVLIIQLLTMVLYYFIRADGFPILATSALVVGALLNIALDALFVGHWGWGLKGAAYATAIAQSFQFIVLSSYFFRVKRTLRFRLYQTNWREIASAAYNGMSEFINEISAGLVLLLLNWLLIINAGVAGVAAFTIVNYAIFLSLMLSYGVADALHLLVSQNYGAQQYLRVKGFLLTALASVMVIGLILAISLLNWHPSIIPWFLSADTHNTAHIAERLVWLIWPVFLVNGANVVLSCYLTAIHQSRASAIIAFTRSLLFPATYLYSLFWLLELKSVPFLSQQWDFLAALPLAEWSAFTLALWFLLKHQPMNLRLNE